MAVGDGHGHWRRCRSRGRGSLPPSPTKQAKWLNASVSFGLTVVGVPDNIHTATVRSKQHQHQPTNGKAHSEPPQPRPPQPAQLPKRSAASESTDPISFIEGHFGRPANMPAQITPSIGQSGERMMDGSTAQQPGGTPAVKATKPASQQGKQAAAVQRAAGCNKA